MTSFAELIERGIKLDLVLVIVSDGAPKQAAGTTPTIENDTIHKRLLLRRNNEAVVLGGFFVPSRAPMQHQCLEPKFSQTCADVVDIVRANPLLPGAESDEVIVNRRVSSHAVFAGELA